MLNKKKFNQIQLSPAKIMRLICSVIKWKMLILLVVVGSIFLFLSRNDHVSSPLLYHKYSEQLLHQTEVVRGCQPPYLQLDNPEIMNLKLSDIPVKCDREENWVYVQNGSVKFSKRIVEKYSPIKCELKAIIRGNDDFTWHYGKPLVIKPGDRIPTDGFTVNCTGKSGKTYENVQEAISYQPSIHKNYKPHNLPKSAIGLNVLIIGLDSLSRLHWLRKLPKSHKFLVEKLSAINFEQINVLGDGTPAALFPLFSGMHERELPMATKTLKGSVTLDNFPFIWKNFSKAGYVTVFAEDYYDVSTFTYRLRGFNVQPTDHYARPFYMRAERGYESIPKPPCLGSLPNFRIAMNYINDTFIMYPNRPKFIYSFLGEFTHSRGKLMFTHADVELLGFLERFKDSGYWNNTLMIIMSDHGSRFSELRWTEQGKMEERLPYLSIVFPKWFGDVYPEAFSNIKRNTKSLVTYMDVHETLKDVLEFRETGSGNLVNRGISLFKIVPPSRSCKHANISDHWCSCLSWSSLSLSDPIVPALTRTFIDYVNSLLKPVSDLCYKLKLSSVRNVERYRSRKEVLRFSKSIADDKGFDRPVMEDNTKETYEVFQLTVKTTPGDGVFMFTIQHIYKGDQYVLSQSEISRINKYGDTAACLNSKRTLKIFCYCKSR